MQPVRKPWWQQATALVSLSAGGTITGFTFAPGTAASIASPASLPVHLTALEKAAQPAAGDDATLRSAIVNVTNYYLQMAKTKSPAEMEAIIWQHDSVDGADHGESCAAFASMTLELAAQTVGQQSWVTGGGSYPWPLHQWADVRVDPNPDSLGITSVQQDAQAHGRWHPLGDGYQAQPGDWVLFDGHIEVVTSYANGVLHTVGGDSMPNFSVNAHEFSAPLSAQGVAGFVNNGSLASSGAAAPASPATSTAASAPQPQQQAPAAQKPQAAPAGAAAASSPAAAAGPGQDAAIPGMPMPTASTGGNSRPSSGQASGPAASASVSGRRPAQAGPAHVQPAQTAPVQTGPAQTGPAQTGPAQTGPTQTGTAHTATANIPGAPAPAPAATSQPSRAVTPQSTAAPGSSSPGSSSQGSATQDAAARATAAQGTAALSAAAIPGVPVASPQHATPAKHAPAPEQAAATPVPSATRRGRHRSTSTSASTQGTSAQQAFINAVAPGAAAAQRRYGVPAAVTIAQAIDESGWGQSQLASRDNNLFGIKGTGPAGSDALPTQEYLNGQWVSQTAGFRVYSSVAESIDDHGKLLATSGYYGQAMASRSDPNTFANALTGVYATDPSYGQTLIGLMTRYNLYQYDAGSAAATPQTTSAGSPQAASSSATPAATPSATSPGATPQTTPAAPQTTPADIPGIATPPAPSPAAPQTTPSATPKTTPAATPQSTPAATPQSTPAATPQSTPAATPQTVPPANPAANGPADIPGIATPTAAPQTAPATPRQTTPAAQPTAPASQSTPSPAATPALTPHATTTPPPALKTPAAARPSASRPVPRHAMTPAATPRAASPTLTPNAATPGTANPSTGQPAGATRPVTSGGTFSRLRSATAPRIKPTAAAPRRAPASAPSASASAAAPASPPSTAQTPSPTGTAPSTPAPAAAAPSAGASGSAAIPGVPNRPPASSASGSTAPSAPATSAPSGPSPSASTAPTGRAASSDSSTQDNLSDVRRPVRQSTTSTPTVTARLMSMTTRNPPRRNGSHNVRAHARYKHQIPQPVLNAFVTTARGPLIRAEPLYRDVASDSGIRWELLAACDWMQCQAHPRYSPVQGEKLRSVNADGTVYRTRSEALGQCANDLAEFSAAVYQIDLTANQNLSVRDLANVFAAFRWGALLRLHHTSALEFPYSVAGLTAQHMNMRWPGIDEPNAPDKPGARFRRPFGAVPIVLGLGYPATV